MASKERYAELADNIVDLLGGKDNISFFTHCMTRLRFNVKDRGLVERDAIEKLTGVVGSQWVGDQFQVIIGQSVADAYNLIGEKTGLARQEISNEDLGDTSKQKFSFAAVLDVISGSIAPVLPVFIACGFLKLIVMLAEQFGLMAADDSTYVVLSLAGDAGFHFLPVYIGGFTARKLGANMGLGMLLGAVMIHPTLVAAVGDGNALEIFGIPMHPVSYVSSVIPIILSVAVMAPIEKLVGRLSPDALRSIAEPFFTLLIMLPLALCVLGPIGSFIGTYMAQAVLWLYSSFGCVAVALVAAGLPWLIMTGMHTAFTPYTVNQFATAGYEPILMTASIISNINQGVASFVVSLKSRDVNLKSTAAACALTAVVGGVSEPAMFGVNLRLMKPMFGAMIGSFCGALVAGFGNAAAFAMSSSTGLLGGLPVYLGGGMSNLLWMVAGLVVGVAVTFVATFVLYKVDQDVA